MVGLVILPFSIANEVLNSYWIFGDVWCTAWLTMDIWMCTASIYNLVAISIDRYIAIIKPLNYPMLITKFRARCIVAAVWIGSFIICSPSFLLASTERKATTTTSDSINDCRCTPSNSGMAYILFSASSSFYLPMIIVIFVYVRIYIAACAATKSVYSGMMQVTAVANKNPKNILMQNPSALSRGDNMAMLRVHRGSTVKNEQLEILKRAQSRSSTQYSTDNIHQILSNDVSLRICGRYSMDDDNFLHPSPPGLQQTTKSPTPPNEKGTAPSQSQLLKMKMIYEQKTPAKSPSGSLANAIGNALINESISNDIFHKAHYDSNVPEDPLIEKNVHDSTTMLYSSPGFTNRVTAISESSSASSKFNMKHHKNDEMEYNGNVASTTAFLHPNAAKAEAIKKKRRYGASVLSRLIRRGPRKKAGCAYEKRLSLEIKAAKTVAIVTGCFIFCWLGFSILYGLSSFAIHSNEIVWSIVFWLGYLNSALNPVIYTVFNREFRTCFKRLLTCNHVIFASRSTNQTMYNSYNSQMRNGQIKSAAGGNNSSISGPSYNSNQPSPNENSSDS